MDVFWVPITFFISATVMVTSIVAIVQLKDYKLKKEQIRANIAIKTEEINARNRLEIERLSCKDHEQPASEKGTADSSFESGGRGDRLRY